MLDIDDIPEEQIDKYFDNAHQFIREGLQDKEGVLVVCTAGISRSATIVISYLIKECKLSYEGAY